MYCTLDRSYLRQSTKPLTAYLRLVVLSHVVKLQAILTESNEVRSYPVCVVPLPLSSNHRNVHRLAEIHLPPLMLIVPSRSPRYLVCSLPDVVESTKKRRGTIAKLRRRRERRIRKPTALDAHGNSTRPGQRWTAIAHRHCRVKSSQADSIRSCCTFLFIALGCLNRINTCVTDDTDMQHNSCGHTTEFYLGKNGLPRGNLPRVTLGKHISGFNFPRREVTLVNLTWGWPLWFRDVHVLEFHPAFVLLEPWSTGTWYGLGNW